MSKRVLVQGNEAVGHGAISAGVKAFFGYPITPQNEITEWFSRELPDCGGVFIQSQCETGAINMLIGAASTGFRAITSTSGPGWALMQEGVSCLCDQELPCVIVLVQRGGPGGGTTRHAQMDYRSTTKGGGHGGYRTIVLAPASVQETADMVQLAFYLADKYRNPVVVLTDAILGQTAEPLDIRTIDFGPLPDKDWAVAGSAHHKDGKRRMVLAAHGIIPTEPPYDSYLNFLEYWQQKYRKMEDSELRFESVDIEDAQLVLVAYGYTARVSLEAIQIARSQGYRVGLIRPITLWPFPRDIIAQQAARGAKFLVVEDSLGQLVEDVISAVKGQVKVNLLDVFARHTRTDGGMILPGRVYEEIRKIASN